MVHPQAKDTLGGPQRQALSRGQIFLGAQRNQRWGQASGSGSQTVENEFLLFKSPRVRLCLCYCGSKTQTPVPGQFFVQRYYLAFGTLC